LPPPTGVAKDDAATIKIAMLRAGGIFVLLDR
jgi:hypothetical protein